MRKLLLYGLFALLPLSCSRESAVLREAERTLRSDPEAALARLDSLDRTALSARQQARYDYLSASAFYGCYYFLDDAHSQALAKAYAYRERERNRLSNSALLVAAILATLVLYFRARKIQAEKQLLQEKAENERMLSVAEDLEMRLGVLQQKGERKLPVDALDRLCEQYYIYEGTENLQPKILKEVQAIVDGLRSDPAMQRSLEQSLDRQADGVMTRLRAAFPKWKEEDYLLYLFTASGFSSTTVSALLEKDKPYIYNRLYRLKERIRSSSVPDRNFLLAFVEK